MKKFYNVDYVVEDILKVLCDNPYSPLWEIVEDFEINGHIVSVKKSTQYKQVIVDGRYVQIDGCYQVGDITYVGTAYIKSILSK